MLVKVREKRKDKFNNESVVEKHTRLRNRRRKKFFEKEKEKNDFAN